MSVQTNFRAEDMLGAQKAVPAAEAKKITGTAGKKAAKPVEPVVEAVVEVPVVEDVVVEEAPVVEPVEESAE
jgi:hypothetical protein